MDNDIKITPDDIGRCLNCNGKLEDRHFMYDYNNNFCTGQCKDGFLRRDDNNNKIKKLLPKLQYFKI